jgi:hypothetical protein
VRTSGQQEQPERRSREQPADEAGTRQGQHLTPRSAAQSWQGSHAFIELAITVLHVT